MKQEYGHHQARLPHCGDSYLRWVYKSLRTLSWFWTVWIIAFTISELSLLTSGSGADGTQTSVWLQGFWSYITHFTKHFDKFLTFALHLQLLVEIDCPLFSVTTYKIHITTGVEELSFGEHTTSPARSLRQPCLHSQLFHLVSLAASVRAPLKLNYLWVQSHDLVIQVTHFCHLQDKAGTV